MKISRIPVGAIGSNCYFLQDENTGDTAVIDAGGNAKGLIEALKANNCKVKFILLTHCHYDHTGAVMELSKEYDVNVYLSKEEFNMLNRDGSGLFSLEGLKEDNVCFLEDNEELTLGSLRIKCIATPGHSPGGLCFLVEDVVFTGDTLFLGSVGRTDFLGGNHKTLIQSIKDKLLTLSDDTVVLPGHGPESSIVNERNSNPFLGTHSRF